MKLKSMKLKFVKFSAVLLLCVGAFVGFSSFVSDDEDEDASKRKLVQVACAYDCWYQNSQGEWYYIIKAGLSGACQRVDYISTCTPQVCTPVVPC